MQRKAVSDLYKEKVAQLQEAESRLEAEKAHAQQAAQELLEQAEKEGAALVAQAEAAVRQADRDAAAQTGQQAAVLREQMLAETEQQCGQMRGAAMGRMEKAVAYIVEKVVNQ